MAAQQYSNLAQGTLASAYTIGDTTLALTTGQGALFPASGDFIVALDEPPAFFLKCTGRATDTLTILAGGQEGTTTANKAIGVKVAQVITVGVLDAIRADQSQVGVYASLPTGGMRAGDRYRTTDSPYEFIYDGSIWQPFAFGRRIYLPGGSWVWESQATGLTLDTTKGMYSFVAPAAGVLPDSSVYWKAAPATPYKIHALFQLVSAGGSTPSYSSGFAGMFLGRSSDGAGNFLAIRINGDVMIYNVTAGNTNYSAIVDSGSSNTPVVPGGAISGGLLALAIEDDGTNKTYGLHDGFGNTATFVTRGHTQDITPDHIGIYITAPFGMILNLISWHEF